MNNQRTSIFFSLIAHILLLLLLISATIHNSNILVPARSNGIEVNLITPDQVMPTKEINLEKPEPIKTLNNNAEINVKQVKIEKIHPQELTKKTIEKTQIRNNQVNKSKQIANKNMNDLLHGLGSKSTGHNKGIATNGINSGTSNSNSLVNSYADLVIEKVRPYVNIPDNVDNNSVAIVEVTLLPNMHIYQLKLIKSSGSDEYDDSVQNAIKRGASIFPPLPAGANWNDFQVIKLTFRPY